MAILVAILGTPATVDESVEAFHQMWAYVAVMALVSGLLGALIPRPSPAPTGSEVRPVAPSPLAPSTSA